MSDSPHDSTHRPQGSSLRDETYYQENSPIPCPHCGSRAVYRLHRTSLEKLATAVAGHYPYFCRNCYLKFYKREKVDPS